MARQPSSTPAPKSADAPPAPAVDTTTNAAPAAPAEAAIPTPAAPAPTPSPEKPKAAVKPAAKAPKAAARTATAATVKTPAAPKPAAPKAATSKATTAKAPAPKAPAPKSSAAKAAKSVAKAAPAAKAAIATATNAAGKIVQMAEGTLSAKVPPQFRELAERNVDQAKKAYEQYVSTTERMLSTLEDATRQAWSGARDVNLRMLGFADANAKAGFDYAERFVKAKDVKEIAALQRDYLKDATERLGQQMREIQQMASQSTKDAVNAAKPKG